MKIMLLVTRLISEMKGQINVTFINIYEHVNLETTTKVGNVITTENNNPSTNMS